MLKDRNQKRLWNSYVVKKTFPIKKCLTGRRRASKKLSRTMITFQIGSQVDLSKQLANDENTYLGRAITIFEAQATIQDINQTQLFSLKLCIQSRYNQRLQYRYYLYQMSHSNAIHICIIKALNENPKNWRKVK